MTAPCTALVHREQNIPGSISKQDNVSENDNFSAQKTSEETGRNIPDMRL